MWRWVARGLFGCVLALLAPAAFAQDFVGSIEVPAEGQTLSGMVIVRGFAIDPLVVSRVDLYVDDQFQHSANINIPRIDIIEAFPNYPGIQTRSPGFQTGFLASRFTTGPHTIHARILLSDGRSYEVGRRTILIDNSINQSPFGYLDIPGQSAVHDVNGSFPVLGWAADTDGIARVDVSIDGLNMQSAIYGGLRPDVGNTFPDFPASMFSGFIANIDTTRVQDGVHTLTVRVTDRLGLIRDIASRTVQIFNSENNLKPFGALEEPLRGATLYGTNCTTVPPFNPAPFNPASHLTPVRGWALDLGTRSDLGHVSYVELLIDGVKWYSTDDCSYSSAFNAYVNCYGLTRFDVQRYYPTHPDSPRSGFLFTLDVGGLMALGVPPGSHTLKLRVGDQEQTFTDIPDTSGIPVFFACAPAGGDFPSAGYIDYPWNFAFLGGTVTFSGWALDENGTAAVEIWVDGNRMGLATYGIPRADVQAAYPTIANSFTSGWRFTIDTRQFSDARHRLVVRAIDSAGRGTEIGSADFVVDNPN